MKRAWIGLALLSACWLTGLGTYHDPNWTVWAVLVSLGTGLLMGVPIPRPTRTGSALAAGLLIVPNQTGCSGRTTLRRI